LVVALIGGLLSVPALAGAEVRVALVPISVNAAGGDTEYLSAGLGDMLSARLEQYAGLDVVRLTSDEGSPSNRSEAVEAARKAGAEFVLFGSFTRFGEGASLDLRCARAGETPSDDEDHGPRRVFIQAGGVAEIIPQLDMIAKKVARYTLGGRERAVQETEPAAAGSAAGDGAGGPSAAEFEDLLHRVDAIERTLYTPVAVGDAPADEAGSSDSDVR
jgi:hypothetical protein